MRALWMLNEVMVGRVSSVLVMKTAFSKKFRRDHLPPHSVWGVRGVTNPFSLIRLYIRFFIYNIERDRAPTLHQGGQLRRNFGQNTVFRARKVILMVKETQVNTYKMLIYSAL
jgi:hypothetical protein